jgi:hypothetical protein
MKADAHRIMNWPVIQSEYDIASSLSDSHHVVCHAAAGYQHLHKSGDNRLVQKRGLCTYAAQPELALMPDQAHCWMYAGRAAAALALQQR